MALDLARSGMVGLTRDALVALRGVLFRDAGANAAAYLQEAGYAARQKGWTPLMELTAGISLNLGIFNLLPIPILDGGVIMLLLIEGLMRRDISLHIKERIYQAAFVFLLLFAVMVIYNDLVKTLPGLSTRLP